MRLYNAVSDKTFHTVLDAIDLDMKEHRVISFVGAGGKTTLMYCLAEELSKLGYKVVVTTTTHIVKPEKGYYEWKEVTEIHEGEVITVGKDCRDGKITRDEVPLEDYLKKADFVLVEADGSKRKPLKVPAKHEPVIPAETKLVIGILGYVSVGKTIEETAHRVRDVEEFLQKKAKDKVTEGDLEKISFSRDGLLKGVTCDYRIIWNCWTKEL